MKDFSHFISFTLHNYLQIYFNSSVLDGGKLAKMSKSMDFQFRKEEL